MINFSRIFCNNCSVMNGLHNYWYWAWRFFLDHCLCYVLRNSNFNRNFNIFCFSYFIRNWNFNFNRHWYRYLNILSIMNFNWRPLYCLHLLYIIYRLHYHHLFIVNISYNVLSRNHLGFLNILLLSTLHLRSLNYHLRASSCLRTL
jgi:hypothetical protein